ncbi:YqbF domain-containing protein [Bacillus atrophaeus]|uniref:YqbF domain-containing protein n=1 Tax=Bacillus atrophaeus TaxID=1452 RepID=UPI00240DD1D8|nr:YqbF domain-containing protein [Bacillus atrophaeus]
MADTYTAKLIAGQTYDVMGYVFLLNQKREVEKAVYSYLRSNEQFECHLIKEEPKETEKPKSDDDTASKRKYTETELKGMNKTEQEAIVTDLGGNPSDFKNADERIAFILEQQGKEE